MYTHSTSTNFVQFTIVLQINHQKPFIIESPTNESLHLCCCYIVFFSIYILGLVLQWVKDQGGVEKMAENSKQKSEAVYDVIEKSNGFYQ